MNILLEILGEFLLDLPDYDPAAYRPFGWRYWLACLGLFCNYLCTGLLILALLVCLAGFAQGRGWVFLVLGLAVLVLCLFLAWRTLRYSQKILKITRYYRKIGK